MNKQKKSRIITIIMLALFLYSAYILIGQQKMINVKNSQKAAAELNIKNELKTNSDLKKQKEEINSDAFNERVAREELGMVKRGERIFVDSDK